MIFIQRRLFSILVGIAIALIVIQLFNLSGGPQVQATSYDQHRQSQAQSMLITCSTPCSFYGSNYSWMVTATSDWYQHQGNWCGIANIRAIQRYDWLYYNGGIPQWDNSQEAIHNRLNSYSSPWGHGRGGYVQSDISGDGGTDPHSIAYGAWYDTPPSTSSQPYWFHNWIYMTDSTTATYDFSTDFGQNTVSHNDPISVTIDGGYHSFVVDGVWASSDPSLGGATIDGIDTWDPWLNSSNNSVDGTHPYNQTQNQVWSLTDWTTNRVMWGQGYNTNNGFDPEPDTPKHYYVPPFKSYGVSHHWNTYYITIEQDRINDATISHDYALDQNGNLAPHN